MAFTIRILTDCLARLAKLFNSRWDFSIFVALDFGGFERLVPLVLSSPNAPIKTSVLLQPDALSQEILFQLAIFSCKSSRKKRKCWEPWKLYYHSWNHLLVRANVWLKKNEVREWILKYGLSAQSVDFGCTPPVVNICAEQVNKLGWCAGIENSNWVYSVQHIAAPGEFIFCFSTTQICVDFSPSRGGNFLQLLWAIIHFCVLYGAVFSTLIGIYPLWGHTDVTLVTGRCGPGIRI